MKQIDILGARKDVRGQFDSLLRRDSPFAERVVGAESRRRGRSDIAHGDADRLALRRRCGGEPVFVSDADPAALALHFNRALQRFRIFVLIEFVADHSDGALVQDRLLAGAVWNAALNDKSVGRNARLSRAVIAHGLLHGEHEVSIDGVGLGERQIAGARGHHDRRARRQRRPCGRRPCHPLGSHPAGRAVLNRDEPLFNVMTMFCVVRREEPDHRAVRVNRLAIILERQIVDAPAREVNRAHEARRIDFDPARRLRERFFDRQRHRRQAHAGDPAFGAFHLWCGGGLGRARGADGLPLRTDDERVPSDQDSRRQDDEKDDVAIHEILLMSVGRTAASPHARRDLCGVGSEP